MILHVAGRELREHLRSARFLALCALTVLLMPLGAQLEADAWARREGYARWLLTLGEERARRADATRDPEGGVRWGWHGGEGGSDAALRAVRPPAPLAVLAAGDEASLPAWWQFSSEGVEAGGAPPAGGGMPLDAVFVVQVVLGLLALLLTFDAIAGEQESGVLRMVLAHPVPRLALLLGKFAGALVTLAVPLVAGATGALLVVRAHGVPVFGADVAGRLALLALAALLYVATMVAIGLAASALARRGKSALVALLLAWTLIVLVLPRAATVAASALRPVAGEEVERRERRDALLALERERAGRLAIAWRRASGGDELPQGAIPPALLHRFRAERAPVEAELARRKRAALRATADAHARDAESRRRLARALAAPSPAALFAAAAEELAGTGEVRRGRVARELRVHQERLEPLAFDRPFGVELFAPALGDLRVRWAPDPADPADRPPRYAELPPFRFSTGPDGRELAAALPPLALLAAMLAVALAVAAVAVARYEVR